MLWVTRYLGQYAILFAVAFALISPSQAVAKANPKYASLVIDADTGQVLFGRYSKARRYPASLTKMMTLYMLFEQLDKGKMSYNTRLKVSKRAASMPQTNISLRAGDRIRVSDAIKALIVRSANDVAVVVAEAIGKTEWNFGLMMTRKARSMGMYNTVFRNASGLPNRKQYSTARDMATLAIRLQRDYPQYFHHFKTQHFTHKGTTYKSHNKLLRSYPGVDGIKTGYTIASGFNLVSSVNKNGHRLIGVVMGGRKAKSRDRHMQKILTQSFAKLRIPRGVRLAKSGIKIPIPQSRPGVQVATANTFIVPVPNPRREVSLDSYGGWGVQVGAFRVESNAIQAAKKAQKQATPHLDQATLTVYKMEGSHKPYHQARFVEFTQQQAKTVCDTLQSKRAPCFVYRVAQGDRD